MQDDAIRLLYIEYSFLGNRGEDMETVSVPKMANQEMVYNYKKSMLLIFLYVKRKYFPD